MPRLGLQVAAAMMPPERRARRSTNVFRVIAALMLASAAGASVAAVSTPKTTTSTKPATAESATDSSDTLVASSPWWEKVTVTIAGNGKAESCVYESSLKPNATQSCDVADTGAAAMSSTSSHSSDSKQEYTRITFERRFDPNALPAKADLQKGDTLLGGQVMSLAIDGRGHVDNCKIVAQSGDMQPQYGCDEASAEKFQASAATGAAAVQHQGFMTILVYGHSEHMV
jgi:hypothetical protein